MNTYHAYFIGRDDLIESTKSENARKIKIPHSITKIHGGFRSFFATDIKQSFMISSQNIWAFGDNQNNQLGIQDRCIQFHPVRVSFRFDEIVCTRKYSYGIRETQAYSWGEQTYGCSQQGYHSDIPSKLAITIQSMCAEEQRFYFISSNNLYGVGLTSILGAPSQKLSISKPLLIKQTVDQVSCSQYHALCISDMKVYSWGYGEHAELGLPMIGYQFQTLILEPTLIPELDNIIQVQCANWYSLALTQEGRLLEWGRGFSNLEFMEALQIRQVKIELRIKSVSACIDNCAAIDTLGRLYTWSKYHPISILDTRLRATQVIQGDNITVFLASLMSLDCDQFRMTIRNKLQMYKLHSDLKNRKATNQYYDKDSKVRCLSEVFKSNFEPLDIKPELRLIRKSSIPLVPTRKFSLHAPKKKTINFDKVTDQILDSERNNPIYIPLRQRVDSQQQAQTERKFSVYNDRRRLISVKEDKEILKYEYINQVLNGHVQQLFVDNIKDESYRFMKIRRIKNDNPIYELKLKKFKQMMK